MPKNNSKARKTWRKNRVAAIAKDRKTPWNPEERLLAAIFGTPWHGYEPKPGTDDV